ncbi:hypothetical protein P7C73_g3626, partial [Tremellales sp. Uapishka_1]
MVLPSTISEVSPSDPLLLLPIPSKLPSSPLPSLDPLLSAIDLHLSSPSPSHFPMKALTAQMRQITRHSQILLNAARVGAADARAHLNGVDGVLRGVEYERGRVREEIERCLDYVPAYAEMDIMDNETFLSSASAEILSTLPSTEHVSYEHAIHMARLQHELDDVLEREALLASLTKERDSLIKAKKEIKLNSDKVDVYLADFAKTTSAIASKVKDVAKVSAP